MLLVPPTRRRKRGKVERRERISDKKCGALRGQMQIAYEDPVQNGGPCKLLQMVIKNLKLYTVFMILLD